MSGAGKGAQVQSMFDRIAPRYDLMNRLMTFGQDQRWRRFVVDKAKAHQNGAFLDLASGTGDIAFEMRRRNSESKVVAGDFSEGMLEMGKARPLGDTISWVVCDAMNLPFSPETFDAVTFGYLLRNVESIEIALKETARVLKPGGRVVCLDTTPPKGFMKPFVNGYLKLALPLLGKLIAGDASAYSYLSQSTLAFETPEELQAAFQAAGFKNVQFKTFMLGTIAVHWGEKA